MANCAYHNQKSIIFVRYIGQPECVFVSVVLAHAKEIIQMCSKYRF